MPKYEVSQLLERFSSYQQGAAWIEKEVEAGRLRPVLSSGFNGKVPRLYKIYQTIKPKEDFSPLKEELSTKIMPPLSSAWYLRHLCQYKQDRPYVLALNSWVLEHGSPGHQGIPVSVNERSFELFGEEKYLKKSKCAILGRLGLPEDFLACYMTSEPLVSWYSLNENTHQNVLIVENLDPFVSLRRMMMESAGTHSVQILGIPISTVIYGGGKRIVSSFEDLLAYGQNWLKDPSNTFYYLGDFDYEGISIFESFISRYPLADIRLFTPGYYTMLALGTRLPRLPKSAQGQSERPAPLFWNSLETAGNNREQLHQLDQLLSVLSPADHSNEDGLIRTVALHSCRRNPIARLQALCQKGSELLQEGCYIPQEILSRSLLTRFTEIPADC